MDTAQTAGIVVVTVAIIQGLIGLVKYMMNREKETDEDHNIGNKLDKITEKLSKTCLSEVERDQLKSLYDMHARYDGDGVPMWYIPRSWADVNKEIADKLQHVGELQFKMLGIIERLERRLELLDKPGGL